MTTSVDYINYSIIINAIYRPPVGKIKPFKPLLKDILSKNTLCLIKQYILIMYILLM